MVATAQEQAFSASVHASPTNGEVITGILAIYRHQNTEPAKLRGVDMPDAEAVLAIASMGIRDCELHGEDWSEYKGVAACALSWLFAMPLRITNIEPLDPASGWLEEIQPTF
jgi:hypothetical protein